MRNSWISSAGFFPLLSGDCLRKDKNPVTVFLVNGVKLQGIITWFDTFSLLLRRDGVSQLVYKHAISTIMPTEPLSFFEEEER